MSYMYNAAPISGLDVAVTSKGMLIGETGVQGAITALQFSGKYEDQLQQNQYNTTANAIIVWNPQYFMSRSLLLLVFKHPVPIFR